MPTLDDESIDFPSAYEAVALLVRNVSLSQEDINAMAGRIEVEGTPRITPPRKWKKPSEKSMRRDLWRRQSDFFNLLS